MSDYTLYGFLCALAIVAFGYLLCSLFSWSLNYDKWNKFSITLKNVLCWIGYVPIAFVTFLFVDSLFLRLCIKLVSFFSPESTPAFSLLELLKVIFFYAFYTSILIITWGISASASGAIGYVLCPSKSSRIKSLPIAISITIFEVFNMISLWQSSSIYGNVMSVICVLLSLLLCAATSIDD